MNAPMPGAAQTTHGPGAGTPPSPKRRIAVLTSGGDAPGMNPAIRAVVRTGLARGVEVFGVRHGYSGLIAGDFRCLSAREVGGIIDRGGTMLGTSRCPPFLTEEGQREAVRQLASREISGLIVVGGSAPGEIRGAKLRRGRLRALDVHHAGGGIGV